MSVPVHIFIGSAKISLASHTYRMHIHLCPLLNVTGNIPVSSVYTLTLGLVLTKRRCIGYSSCLTLGSGSFSSLDFVDLIFFRV